MFRYVLLLAGISVFLAGSARAAGEGPSFGREVTPVLYKLGCSAGSCHGAFAGKNGFRLSLFASDPEADFANLRGPGGRRVNPLEPDKSLLLLKPTLGLSHEGGRKLVPGGPEYRLLRDWIAGGARFEPADAAVLSVRLEPPVLTVKMGKSYPLRVLARLSDGKEEDVTHLSRFETLDEGIARVSADGRVTGNRSGDVAILAHYAGRVGFNNVLVPGRLPPGWKFPGETLADPVDRLLAARLKKLNIAPSPICTDEEFLRRVYLDVTGQLPLPGEIRAFQADKAPDRRARLIDRLLAHPLHAAFWAGQMCDMVGADDRFIGDGVYLFHDWFRNKFENNLGWDKIAYGVICATASDDRSIDEIQADLKKQAEERKKKKDAKAGPAPGNRKPWQTGYAGRKTLPVFYDNLLHRQEANKRIVDSRKIALRLSHTFLGVRLECAQCHKHPHDRWSQADFLSFASAFAYVDFGVDPDLQARKVSFSGTHVSRKPAETFLDPARGEVLGPRILGGQAIVVKPGIDPRKEIWKWLVGPDNPYFARALVNRVWAHYLGRGLIEPADALAAANPPSHPEVLDDLVRDFVSHGFDIRRLERRILNTLAYQRSWKTNPGNSHDLRNYSHRLLRRLTAEQALDAIAQITGTPITLPKRYAQVRPGVKAVELATSRVGGDDGYVLQIFGKPLRVQNCDCERSPAASLSQALYLYNDAKLLAKIADGKGRLPKLLLDFPDDRKLLDELYLLTLTRRPTAAETEKSITYLKTARSRGEGFQDILWSLLNRDEFIINH